MLLDRKEVKREQDKTTLIEAYYDSTNILKSNYIPERNFLFIFFENKQVYSYSNINQELYDKFEQAKSQGKFFISEIKKKPMVYNYMREYKLYDFEKQDISIIIENLKTSQNDKIQNI